MNSSNTATSTPTKRNLRHHLRIPTHLSATVTAADGQQLQVEIANLSRAGVMLACDRQTLEFMHPKVIAANPGNPMETTLAFTIPSRIGGKITIQCTCHIIYARRLSKDLFYVGLEFRNLEDHLVPHLEQYIESHKEG